MQEISTFVGQFVKDSGLQQRIIAVLHGLPTAVVHDLLSDERFTMVEYDPRFGQGAVFPVATPGVGVQGSRMIAWKTTLAESPLDFASYVIAHEFAHAWLRNRGRTADEDPEDAADALAAEWGYHKPVSAMEYTWWRRS